MNPFLKINSTSLISFLMLLVIISTFGFNFLLNLLGNILLLIFLIPLLIFLIALICFNSLKTKVNVCDQCGNISLGVNNTCNNCGANLTSTESKNTKNSYKPGEATIDVKAEEIN